MVGNPSRASVWIERIDDWKSSGLSLPKFCVRHGINKATMNRWLYKPECKRAIERARQALGVAPEKSENRTVESPPKPTPAFVPVRLREIVSKGTKIPESTPCGTIEILVGERRIAVSRGFDAETLRQVIAVLESGL
jgi:hypothetical protein